MMKLSLEEKRKKHADYMRAWCARNRAKVNADEKRRRLADPEWNAKRRAYRARNRYRVRAQKKLYRERNPERLKELKHQSYLRTKTKVLVTCSRWVKANPEKVQAIKKAWAKRNPEHKRIYYQANKDRLKKYISAYRKKNLHKKREWEHRRRAAKLQLPTKDCSGKIALLKTKCFCHWCCEPFVKDDARSPRRLTIDHVTPLSRGGHHIPDNLVASCHQCNLFKHNKLVSEWMRPNELKEAA